MDVRPFPIDAKAAMATRYSLLRAPILCCVYLRRSNYSPHDFGVNLGNASRPRKITSLIATTEPDLILRCSEGLRGNGRVVSSSDPGQLCEMVRKLGTALLLLGFYLVNCENLQDVVRIKLVSAERES